MMKVLMLHLPRTRVSYLSAASREEPLAHVFLSSALRPRHELRFIDMRLTPRLETDLGGFRPDAALAGVTSLSIGAIGGTLRILRNRFSGIKILLFPEAEYGNSHVEARPLDFVHPLADALVQPYFLAQLRQIIPAVLEAWAAGASPRSIAGVWVRGSADGWTCDVPAANDAGDIGVPDRTLLGKARGHYRFAGIGRMAYLFYTFGCKFKCRFCPMSKFEGPMYTRSLDDVIEELRQMSEPNVLLADFEPFLYPDAMSRLADAVERAGIRKNWYMLTRSDTALAQSELIRRWMQVGLHWLYLGLDGFSTERLREIRKSNSVSNNEAGLRRMQELGLSVAAGFVVPSNYDKADFAALRSYVRYLKPPLFDFTVETPLVGTKLFDETQHELTSRDWSLFDLQHAVLPTKLPLDEFYEEMGRLHMMAGFRSLPAFVRHYSLRDVVRTLTLGLRAISICRGSARDHERGDH